MAVRKYLGLMILGGFLLISAVVAFGYKYPSLTQIKSHFRSSGLTGLLTFSLIYLAASLLFVPKNILTLVAGSVFGCARSSNRRDSRSPSRLLCISGAGQSKYGTSPAQ
jgi:uncharacterized membrane protein YdjX (TVP38/TMEM64 family)